MKNKKFNLKVPAFVYFSDSIKFFIADMAANNWFSRREVNLAKLITDEVFINAIRHWSTEDWFVSLEGSVRQGEIKLAISDQWNPDIKMTAAKLRKIIKKEKDENVLSKTSWRWLAQIAEFLSSDFKVSDVKPSWIKVSFTLNASDLNSHLKSNNLAFEWNDPDLSMEERVFTLIWEINNANFLDIWAPIDNFVSRVDSPTVLVFDCSKLEFISSDFISSIAGWHSIIDKHWWTIIIKNAGSEILDIFDMLWFDKIIKFT